MRRQLLNQNLGGTPYDVGCMKVGRPEASEIILRFIAARKITFPANFASSQAKAGTAGTASATFDAKKNGAAAFGTFNFAGAATVATFTLAAAESFEPGDVLTIVAPGSQDATLADLTISLWGFTQ